jgi:glycosyltransferase involved in cell wall biosynthesis
LLICGKIKFSDSFFLFEDRFEYNKFMPYAKFIDIYKKVDIILVPLTDTKFNHGKSELKFIEAGAFGITTVASESDTYSRVINHGKNGILISKNGGWNFWIEKLIYDHDLRNKIGNAARDIVIKKYNPSLRATEYIDFCNDLIRKIETKFNPFLYNYYIIIASLVHYTNILKKYIKLRLVKIIS